MKTKAKVISVQGLVAIVEVRRSSACDGCHKMADSKKGCTVCSLMGGGTEKFTSRADNTIGANVGDTVFVESATSKVLFYAMLVFILPIITAFIGWFLSSLLTESTPWRLGGAAVAFFATFLGLHVYSCLMRKKQPDVVITEIVPDGESVTAIEED